MLNIEVISLNMYVCKRADIFHPDKNTTLEGKTLEMCRFSHKLSPQYAMLIPQVHFNTCVVLQWVQ